MTPNFPDAPNSLDDWNRLRLHLAHVEDEASASTLPGVLYADTRPVPLGFSDLTLLITEKGVPLAPGMRIGVEPDSALSRTICEALFGLPPGAALGRALGTGEDVAVVRALITLLRTQVLQEAALVELIARDCGLPPDALPPALPHALAQVGVEPAGDEGLSLAERLEALRQAGLSPTRFDEQGLSAMHYAAAHGNVPALAALAALGCPMHRANDRGITPLHWAAGHRQAASLRFLLSELPAPTLRPSSSRGSASLADWLATEKGSVENPDALGRTALHMLFSLPGGRTHTQAFIEAANVLFEAGGALHVKDFRARTPLDVAVEVGGAEHIAGLQAVGALRSDIDRQRLLMVALRGGKREVAGALLSLGSPIFRHQAVIEAARTSSRLLRELAALPGDLIEAPDAVGRSPAQALAAQISDWVALERSRDAPHVLQGFAALVRLSEARADMPGALTQKIVASAVSFDSYTRSDRTHSAMALLTRAGLMHQPDQSVQEMLSNVLKAADARPELRPTLLKRVYNLLYAGARVSTTSARRIVRAAALNRDGDVLCELRQLGLHVDTPGDKGTSPMQYFVVNGRIEPVKELLRAGANVDHVMDTGDTALHIAVGMGHMRLIEVLLKAGARTDLKNDEGKIPRDYALNVDHPAETKKALKALLPPAPGSGVLGRLFQRRPSKPASSDSGWTVTFDPRSKSAIPSSNPTNHTNGALPKRR